MFRMLVILALLALVAAWWMGYLPRYAPATATSGRAASGPGTSEGSARTGVGPIDTGAARQRGAQIGEEAADAANRLARGLDDGAITAKITSKMALDDTVRARDVRVHTAAGVVTLTGVVGSEAERQKALQLARDTDGVRSVKDQLEVRR
jgi:hypothetical protein